MLTPVTGVDGLSRKRPVARGSDTAEIAVGRMRPYLRPQSGRDRRAIEAAYMRAVGRVDLLLCKLTVAASLAAGLVVLAIFNDIGARLATRQLALCGVSASYFGLCWYLLGHGYQQHAKLIRWVNATAEPTFVTVAILIIADTQNAAWAASTPVFMLYALALAIGVCRMEPVLCVYSAAVASIGYLSVYFGTIEPSLTAEFLDVLPTLEPWGAWERIFWLSLIAGALAFATHRMRSLAFLRGTEQWRRQRIEAEFGRFVSPDVVQAIMRGEAGVGAAERREVTVLFCDLRDFTGLCEKEAPEDIVGLLNTFYEEACKIIRAHGGTVNKFLGDGMLALFGAPDEHPNHAQAACEAAHEIIYSVDQLRKLGGVWAHLEIGIGLDSGDVVCGAVGAQSRLEYTAIGSIVNRAARLQGLTRRANRRIVLSRSCVKRLGPRANVISFGQVQLKGFDEPVPVYAFRYS